MLFIKPHASHLASNNTLKPNPAVQDVFKIKCLYLEETSDICHETSPEENNISKPSHNTPSHDITTPEALQKDQPVTTTIENPVNDSPTAEPPQNNQIDSNIKDTLIYQYRHFGKI